MPYWGANVRNGDYVIQAKIHGAKVTPAPDELIEFISHQVQVIETEGEKLAEFFAQKIANAFVDHQDALFVTVDILSADGKTYGYTSYIWENDLEYPRVRQYSRH